MIGRVALALLFLFVSSGCSVWTAERPLSGGTLTIRLKSDVPLINPLVDESAAQGVLRLVFSGLTKVDGSLAVQPDLAESWEMSPNGLVWTFRLRKNLQWHDGAPLTVDDIAYTFRYLLRGDPLSLAQADLQQFVEDVAVIDSSSFRLTLRRVFAPLLADTTVPILPKHIWSQLSDPREATIAIGSGPFRLADQKPGQIIILDANPNHYGGRPFIDRLAIMTASEDDTLQAIDNRQLILAEVDSGSLAKVPVTYDLHAYTELGYNYVGFNMRPGRLFADKNLRVAWDKGIDKEGLVASATGGKAQPIWGPIPLASWAYDSPVSSPAHSRAEARKLLADSGWKDTDGDGIADKDGRPLSVELFVRADARDRVVAAQLMAKQLREVGFDVKVSPADFSSVMAAKRRPPFDFDAILMGWNIGPDPDSYYLFASGQIPSDDKPDFLNYGGFKNAEYDRLAIEARTTLVYSQRKPLYAKIQALVAEDLPYYFLWSERTYLAASLRLRGPVNLDSPVFLWNVEKWYLSG